MNKKIGSLVALVAALGLGSLAPEAPVHATATTGACSGGGLPEHVITHVSTSGPATFDSGVKMLVPTTTGLTGVVCLIDGASFTAVPAPTSTSCTFEVWKITSTASASTTLRGKYIKITDSC